MSHGYYVVCLSCANEETDSVNHGREAFIALYFMRYKLAALAKEIRQIESSASIVIDARVDVGGRVNMLPYFAEHANHQLELRCEYGKRYSWYTGKEIPEEKHV